MFDYFYQDGYKYLTILEQKQRRVHHSGTPIHYASQSPRRTRHTERGIIRGKAAKKAARKLTHWKGYYRLQREEAKV